MRNLYLCGRVLAAFLAIGAGPALADDIKIGAFFDTTGPASFLGDPELKTLQLFIERINAEGGVLGRKLALISYDSAGNAAAAATFAKRLAEQDQVDLVIGGSTSGTSMAAVPEFDKAQVPFIAMGSTEKLVKPVVPWVFKIPPSERLVVEKIYTDMKKHGIAKVALISDTSAYGQAGREVSVEMAKGMGIDIVANETFAPTDLDMTPQLTKVRMVPGLQAVYVFAAGAGAATVTRNFGQLGLKVPMYQTHGVASKSYIEMSGAAAEGVTLPTAALLVADDLPASDPQKPALMELKTAFEERYKTPVPTYAANAYDALMLAVAAIKQAGGTDKAKVRVAIEGLHGIKLVSGTFNLSPQDHNGLDLTALRMVVVHQGAFHLAE